MHNWKVKSWGSIFTFTVSAGLLLALSQAAPAQTPALGSAPQLAPSNLSCNYLAAADPAAESSIPRERSNSTLPARNGRPPATALIPRPGIISNASTSGSSERVTWSRL